MALTRLKIAQTVEAITQVTDQRTLVNDSIQVALDRVYQYHDWPYYLDSKNGTITTVADYSTGTIAINNASKTATITTGVVSSSFVGRKVRIGSDKPYYRINAVDTGANTLTLDTPFQSSSVTAATYEIFKDEYRLNADVDKYKLIRQLQNGVPLLDLSPTNFDKLIPTPQNFADPIYSVMEGTSFTTYTTGTVTSNSTTLTGSGTGWTSVEGLGRMSRLRIGTSVYTVKSVDSDTQITTYEVMSNAVGSTYEIKLNNILIQLYFLPNAGRNLLYRYFRQPELLSNDYDTPDMPYEFHWVLVEGALSWVWRQKGDLNKAQVDAEQRFIFGLESMKQKIGSFSPDRITKRKSCDNIRRQRFDAVENSSFDWRYSAY